VNVVKLTIAQEGELIPSAESYVTRWPEGAFLVFKYSILVGKESPPRTKQTRLQILINAAVPEMVQAGPANCTSFPRQTLRCPLARDRSSGPNINHIESSKSLQGIVATSAQRVSTPTTPFAPCIIDAVCSLSKHRQDL
jgi:hypothetical protein